MTEQKQAGLASSELLRMTTEVVAAYVKNNPLPTSELSKVIQTVHGSLQALNGGGIERSEPLKPAVPVRRSITPDYLVCLEDGKKLKMLKRHLRTTYDMTPEEYRARWGLGADYPMVAPNYAKQRSAFAKKIGLGRTAKRRTKRR
ncbi:MAG: MucR family transcriptional regulator [Pseudomonadota bacterium]